MCVSVCVCVRVKERERECECLCVCLWVGERERKGERESHTFANELKNIDEEKLQTIDSIIFGLGHSDCVKLNKLFEIVFKTSRKGFLFNVL